MPRATPYEAFLQELKAVRLARNMTQAQLAAKIQLSRAQYTAIECGRSMANFRQIHNLGVALDVRFAIGGTDSPFASAVAHEAA